MNILIAGSRNFNDYNFLKEEVNNILINKYDNITIISGCAKGVDKFGEKFAAEYNINVLKFPAQWDLHGKKAGYLRNEEMVNFLNKENDFAIFFWDGESKGTTHTINLCKKKGIKSYIFIFKNEVIN